jgi:catechol 2,3-dioxygenase-like lactoylglutathione lyase family enzyme
MKLGHIEIFVQDPSASLAFYRDVLGAEVVAVQDGGRFVWVKLGDVELLMRPGQPQPAAASYGASRVGFVLYTEDLPARIAQLSARGVQFRGTDDPGGQPVFTDPDGHWFQLVDPDA